jgi:hypothetical protein
MVQVFGALIWLGTHIHQASATGDSTARPASAVVFSYFMILLAGVSLVSFLVLYYLY